ncbi:hypothetical protein CFIO01_12447 [Colletotrichum fioriniae PJ7]|uniref:C2H2-type domain-containing protein n=1 Tax=Colletotrichum fioriniae PJ7 TaxID=1445577 RepID=A0A010QMN0_9PEZI|nr:hypothetical protein CFIO01_12447 [Colletotrichum fioriniae PJ7]
MTSSSRWLTAPVLTSGHILPAMRPVTVDSITAQPDENSPDGRSGVISNGIDEAERPIHAVGSQGRSTFDQAKNVRGKFHCHDCNETYMRESHLLLQSHFPKCYTRRRESTRVGNHLSRRQTHVEKKAARRRAALSQNHGLNHSHGPDIMPADGTVQLDDRESLFFAIWKVSAAALLYILAILNSASQHHKEATEKYIQYLEHFDVSTGMSSIPHTAPEQPHLLCDSAMEVHPEAQS